MCCPHINRLSGKRMARLGNSDAARAHTQSGQHCLAPRGGRGARRDDVGQLDDGGRHCTSARLPVLLKIGAAQTTPANGDRLGMGDLANFDGYLYYTQGDAALTGFVIPRSPPTRWCRSILNAFWTAARWRAGQTSPTPRAVSRSTPLSSPSPQRNDKPTAGRSRQGWRAGDLVRDSVTRTCPNRPPVGIDRIEVHSDHVGDTGSLSSSILADANKP